jgi:serine/threonine-protein kinase
MASVVGATVGSYRILSKLGEGGMGAVYLAEHTLIGRKAAVKVLLPELSHNQEIVNRFFNEARSTAQIKHPGLIDIYDFGYHEGGSAFIVMEFLEGENLASFLRREKRPSLAIIAALCRQIASALSAAHKKGIVHRDLKPDNVFLVQDAEVTCGIRAKVLDFGIAKLAGEGHSGSLKTRTGAVMGTPMYMSPEQCRGAGAVDARADIYSLGCILFEMGCGRVPFIAEGLGEIIAAQIYQPPPSPRSIEPQIAPELERIIERTLKKKPEERHASMEELKSELDRLVSVAETTGRHRIPATLAVGPGGTLVAAGGGAESVAAQGTRKGPTTLGHVASEIIPKDAPRSRRKAVWLGVALGVAVAGTAALLVAGRVGKGGMGDVGARAKEPAGAPEPPRVQEPKVVSPPTVAPAAEKAPEKADLAPPPAPASPKKITLKIDTEPSAAEVFRALDGVRVGRTPFVEEIVPGSGEAVFTLKHAGYHDAPAVLPTDRDGALSVKLVRQTHASAPKAPAGPAKPAAAQPAEKSRKPVRDGVLDPFQ